MKCRTFVTLVWRRDASPAEACPNQRGGRSVANASVTSSRCDAKRKSAAGPPAGAARRAEAPSTRSRTPRRSSTRCRFVAATSWPSAATYTWRSSEIVKVAGASAKPMFVYESFARSRACAAVTIARVVAGRAAATGSTACQSPGELARRSGRARGTPLRARRPRGRASRAARDARARAVSTARASAASSDSPRASAADGSAPPSSSTSSRPSCALRTTPTTVCQVESATVFVPQSKTSESAREEIACSRLLVLVLAVAAAGCGSSKKADLDHDDAPTTTPTSSFKVGLITDTSGLNDRGFNHLAYVGLQKAAAELGVSTRVVRVGVAGRVHPEPERARPAGLWPRDRRRLHRDRRDEGRREDVPEDAFRDRRRLERRRGQRAERRGSALQGAAGRLPRRLRRGARCEGATGRPRSRASAGRSSRRSTGTSRATRPAPRRRSRGSRR